jgi:hypothetical protein
VPLTARCAPAFGAYFGLSLALVYGHLVGGKVRRMPDIAGARTTSDLTAMIGASHVRHSSFACPFLHACVRLCCPWLGGGVPRHRKPSVGLFGWYVCAGTIFLWIMWPSFNCALVEPQARMRGLPNTLLSLTGSVLACFVVSLLTTKKFDMVGASRAQAGAAHRAVPAPPDGARPSMPPVRVQVRGRMVCVCGRVCGGCRSGRCMSRTPPWLAVLPSAPLRSCTWSPPVHWVLACSWVPSACWVTST